MVLVPFTSKGRGVFLIWHCCFGSLLCLVWFGAPFVRNDRPSDHLRSPRERIRSEDETSAFSGPWKAAFGQTEEKRHGLTHLHSPRNPDSLRSHGKVATKHSKAFPTKRHKAHGSAKMEDDLSKGTRFLPFGRKKDFQRSSASRNQNAKSRLSPSDFRASKSLQKEQRKHDRLQQQQQRMESRLEETGFRKHNDPSSWDSAARVRDRWTKRRNDLKRDRLLRTGASRWLETDGLSKGAERGEKIRVNRRLFMDPSRLEPLLHSHADGGEERAARKIKEASSPSQLDVPPPPSPEASHLKTRRPNIILVVTDDLDVELGSLNYMPRLLRLMGDGGALFQNAYTTTPMCCPSRSSMLTGMYIHNHQVFTNHQNCSSPLWQNTHERRSFASYLKTAGYKTGYFGKYLNRYNGSHVPDGWKEWSGLVMNSRYYNYTVNRNSHLVKYGNRYPQDYYPHVITSEGVRFLRHSKASDDPFLLVLSYPAPHGPEDSAPEHAHKFFNASDHHTASYNYAPNPDKQWILQFMDRMSDIQLKFTDFLMTKRLQTLQTIDESIEKIQKALDEMGETDNTYFFFTSDHGYHLGQFGLPKGKSMPFEFDTKVPFLVRGPGVKPGVQLPQIVLNVDLAPTFLDIAGLPRPPHMDGRSILPVLLASSAQEDDDEEEEEKEDEAAAVVWRDSFLIESSGRLREEEELEKKEQRSWERERALLKTLHEVTQGLNSSSAASNDVRFAVNLYTSKHERLEEVCKQTEFAAPCKEEQKWYCVKIGSRWKIKKCRHKSPIWEKHCICHFMQGFGSYRRLDVRERRKQKKFLKKYVTKDLHDFNSKFIKTFKGIRLPIPIGPLGLPRHLSRIHKRRGNAKRRFRRFVEQQNVTLEVPTDFQFGNFTKQLFSLFGAEEEEEEEMTQASSRPGESSDDLEESFQPTTFHESRTDDSVLDFVEEEELRDLKNQIHDIVDELQTLENVNSTPIPTDAANVSSINGSFDHGCDQAIDGQIDCQDEVYRNLSVWRDRKDVVEDNIRRLKQQLHVMKNILTHLQSKKPALFDLYGVDYDGLSPTEDGDQTDYEGQDESLFGSGDEEGEEEEIEAQPEMELKPPDTDQTLPEVGLNIPLVEDPSHFRRKEHETRFHRKKTSPRHRAEVMTSSEHDLYYPVTLPVNGNDVLGEDDNAQQRFCWCDRRVIGKMAVQKARERKRLERQKIKEKRLKRKGKRRKKNKHSFICNYATLNCYSHDNDHWRTPPLWTDGQFCFCMNSANNTYWCLRTINKTHNFLYCEFITGLITYYDLHIDPYQLRNVAFTLSNDRVSELNEKLTRLRTCRGADECDGLRSDDQEEKLDTKDSEKEMRKFEDSLEQSSYHEEETFRSSLRKKLKRQERQRRKKIRKEKKYNLKRFDNAGTVRVPRKSRHRKMELKQRRKERKRDKKRRKRKREKKRLARLTKEEYSQ